MKGHTLNLVINPLAAALIAGGWLSITPLSAEALDVSWVGTGSSWIDPTNWNSNPDLPAGGDNPLINQPGAAVTFDSIAGLTYGQMELGAAGTAIFNQPANDLKVVGLIAGQSYGENAVFNLYGGSFTAGAIAGGSNSGGVLLGLAGDATFNHINGTANIEGIAIAEQGGNATYSFIDGVLNTDRVYVGGFEGSSGTALFQQIGGTHTNSQWIGIGRDSTLEALYDMQGGTLNSAAVDIGYVYDADNPGGLGRFEQSGGTHTVASDLILGRDFGASGVYNLSGSGSVLTVSGDEWVGKVGWGTFNQLAGIHKVNGSLHVDMAVASKGVFNLHGGTLDVSGNTFVGHSAGASGDFYHDGGAHTVTGNLVLGIPAGATGNYTLGGTGSLIVHGSTVIGDSGTGSFTQNGGSFEQAGIDTLFMVGGSKGASGTVTLNGGTFRILGNEEKIGGHGTGYFYQYGGDHQFAGGMYVGDYGYGEYHMLGGNLGPVLDSGGLPIGYSGIVMGEWGATGKFFHGGGKVDVDSITLARQPGSDGYYEMNGAAAVLHANLLYIGQRGMGSFLQLAGSVTVAGNINIAGTAGISGSYELQDGNLKTEQLRIGDSGSGAFTQSGGTNTVATAAGFSILVMAENAGSSGTYNLSGGTLNAETVFVGDSDQAFFHHSGTGTHNVNDLALGIYKNSGEHGQGTYNLQGGTLNSGYVTVGNAGTGTFNQIGGDHNNSGGIVIANIGGSSGTYNLQGGVLNSTTIYVNGRGTGGDGTLLYSGGDLKANIENRGYVELSGAGIRTIDGNVFNDGTWKVTGTHAAYTGTFTNAHAYISDPSVNTFVDLVITENGYLLGGAGDQFHIGGNLESHSLQPSLWSTQNVQLFFIGDSGHDFWITGADLGASAAGYNNNFGWGDLELDGETLNLIEGNDTPGGALYVGTISGLAFDSNNPYLVTNIHGNGLNVYYAPWANPSLNSQTYQLADGGTLAPVPEPETWAMLLAGLGLTFLRWRRGKPIAPAAIERAC